MWEKLGHFEATRRDLVQREGKLNGPASPRSAGRGVSQQGKGTPLHLRLMERKRGSR